MLAPAPRAGLVFKHLYLGKRLWAARIAVSVQLSSSAEFYLIRGRKVMIDVDPAELYQPPY
jgi:hypothetical protein